ncbi:MAG: tetratricopeptide repeat protein [Candidatus Omnitrophica bacterium]|nr:tetratricopeptide repeat protein [Candidatus Omnitrophota bacterium]
MIIPPEKIFMMEDHDRAYGVWKERGVRAGTLVHVDAHIDFGWIPEMDFDEIGSPDADPRGPGGEGPLLNPFLKTRKKMVNIGNYICPAMREGLVGKFYWVVPDETWRSRRGVKYIVEHLQRLLAIKRYASGKFEIHPNCIRTSVFDKEVIACSLGSLERIEGPVLLDIDVDFMITRFIWDDLDPARTPWIFPEGLYERLAPKINDIEALTISYSVEGGFTPLRFKYLGDELRMLYGEDPVAEKRKVMKCKRDALLQERNGKYPEAVALYEDALKMDDRDASIYFNLSLCYQSPTMADMKKAGSFYREAVRLDKTYSTRFNNYGILYLQRGEFRKAEEYFRRLLKIDDTRAAALGGLGHIALHRKKYAEALSLFEDCLCLDGKYLGAGMGAAIAHFKSGSLDKARALFLELDVASPGDPEVSWWLGCIAEKTGEPPEAIEYYKRSVMLGGEGAAVHLRLSRLCLARGLYFRAFEELKRFFQAIRGMLS